jgi:L-lactate utilization protein LutB
MLEVQQYLHRQRTEQRDRKLVLKKKMNEYEVGINKSLLDEAKMKTDLAGQLLRMSQTNRETSYY